MKICSLLPIRTVLENEVMQLLLFDVSTEFKCYFNVIFIILFDDSNLFPLYLGCVINKKDMKLHYKDNRITNSSSRKREKEKYKLVHYTSEKQSTEKLSSTENGRKKLVTASQLLKDGLFIKFNDNSILSVKYHCSCYKRYILRSVRRIKNNLGEISSAENNSLEHKNKG